MMWTAWRPDALTVLKEKKARQSLARYFDVMEDKKPAKFMIAKKMPADYWPEASLEHLWLLHDCLTEDYYSLEKEIDSGQKSLDSFDVPEKSYLDLKAEIARRIMAQCHCAHVDAVSID